MSESRKTTAPGEIEKQMMWTDWFEPVTKPKITDIVSVIRCKDCLWFEKKKLDGLGFCLENGKYWMENDYCSYGERDNNQ